MLANAQSVSDWAAAQIANQVFGSTIAGNGGFVSNSTNDDALQQIHIAIRCSGAFSLYGENLRPRSAQPFCNRVSMRSWPRPVTRKSVV